MQPVAARIAEKIGVLKLMLGALAFTLLMIVPLFLALLSGNIAFLAVMMVVNILGGSAYYALLASTLAAAFPVNVRYTGVSVSYQLCATIIGGSTPLLAQVLLVNVGPWGVAAFYALLVIATAVGVWALSRHELRTARASATATAAS